MSGTECAPPTSVKMATGTLHTSNGRSFFIPNASATSYSFDTPIKEPFDDSVNSDLKTRMEKMMANWKCPSSEEELKSYIERVEKLRNIK